MIQGVHASSVVFADFRALSGDLVAKLSRRLPGIEAAGYPVGIRGAEFKVRLGSVRNEKRVLHALLSLESNQAPFQPQLIGALRLQQDTVLRTKVSFEGKCSRNFDGLSSTAPTEEVRHHANDFCRTILDLLVTAIEGSVSDAPLRGNVTTLSTSVRRPVARPAAKAAVKARTPRRTGGSRM
jgi:hypothetical protein